MIDLIPWWNYSSEIRGSCLLKYSCEKLQNLPYYVVNCKMKTCKVLLYLLFPNELPSQFQLRSRAFVRGKIKWHEKKSWIRNFEFSYILERCGNISPSINPSFLKSSQHLPRLFYEFVILQKFFRNSAINVIVFFLYLIVWKL